MVGYTRYDNPIDFNGGSARVLADTIKSDEEFILGIDCAENRYFKRWGTKLVLTDKRIISLRSKIVGSTTKDYRLNSINHIEYSTTAISGELKLSGSGFNESYDLPKDLGREFVDRARNFL